MDYIEEAKIIVNELCDAAKLQENDVMVVGCSTSEVCGSKIGTDSKPDVGERLLNAIYSQLQQRKIYLAVQCCEHLNRAIVIEREIANLKGYEPVNAIPQPKAGGSLATAAYKAFQNPVVVEEIKADAGIDIGGTLIGMHLKKVAVPFRPSINKIGNAPVICARTRPKFIGGVRAVYDENNL